MLNRKTATQYGPQSQEVLLLQHRMRATIG
jgi:hypothetical protein